MAITKKMRFDIFKRDCFTCQYCGGTPPKVVLEIDHIHPKSKGGDNKEDNYLTSCFDCNRGKSNRSLTNIPQTLKERTSVLKEKSTQMQEYNKFMSIIQKQKEKAIDRICVPYEAKFPDYTLADIFKETTLSMFLNKLNEEEIIEAMQIACSRFNTSYNIVKYFCGICWTKIRENKLN